ncbi:Trk system potassium transporter TrkA [Sulfuriroseicoccus oceanibius]|uniref:Trk system potassium uptake protein TrkA n=1 Tax=Sulfuriroseicoccus oceanibius TaxID=2707525 RepID=A0A6B3L7D8_9BACT|nr:Trk system potassium transporter TrkA [Sulfuriroseicoccus oceanibius]QQL45689.1 Trk system potassium transporter TrkA [Sulfuriroseicoccus oceanibius]
MNIIILGAGEIGRHMALSLSIDDHSTVVIEQDDSVARDLEEQLDARVICADGASAEVLIEAGAAGCDLFLALTSSNTINLVASKVAKTLGAKKTICRVHPGVQREQWIFDYRREFEIDHIFSSENLAAIELAKFIRNPNSVLVEEIARGRVELQQVSVGVAADVVGKTLRELELPARVRVGLVIRDGVGRIPKADDVLAPGDLLTLFGEPRKLESVVVRMRGKTAKDKPKRVVLFGGGEYGYSVAQMLQDWNCRLRIFEQDPDRCEWLTSTLENTTVINADGTSITELREEQVGEADFFVATTGSDEDNVMTCLQAKSLGTESCITLVHRADYADVISQNHGTLGIRAAVSPREATRRELMRFVTSDRFHTMKRFPGAELIELAVPEGSPIVGKMIRELNWPQGCGLVARVHDIHAEVPSADDVLEDGDNLFALVEPDAKKAFVKLVIKG